MGIEPTYSAWKAEVLPLNYTRQVHLRQMRQQIRIDPLPQAAGPTIRGRSLQFGASTRKTSPNNLSTCLISSNGQIDPRMQSYYWWRGEDSNLRRRSRQIYSLIPLATREPLREAGYCAFTKFGCQPCTALIDTSDIAVSKSARSGRRCYSRGRFRTSISRSKSTRLRTANER